MSADVPPDPLIYLVAGEQSGDVLGARLMAALRDLRPGLRFAGVGGPRMAEQGLVPLFPMQELAVMGLIEVLPRLRRLSRLLKHTAEDVRRQRPGVLVTIDSPGFTLRLLRRVAGAGIPRVHYVAPQVWAWREKRVRHYPGLWERLLCLLPFEPGFFAGHGLPASFVGHPVLQSGTDHGNAARFRAAHGLGADAPVLVLMPGSRRSEVPRLLPVFGRTLGLLAGRVPGLVPVVPVASAVAETVHQATANWPVQPLVVTELADKHDAYAAASVALTKSGTSTLELALAGVPMAVTYRVNPVTAVIARHLIRVPHVAMVNLLAGREVVPELLQQDCTPARLAETVENLLNDRAAAEAQRAAFRTVVQHLAPPVGLPSEAAAREVLAVLDGH
ncbi:Lipid-A-disaccharide synthase [Rhodovastum atsumiense]|uniref:Lipid-A-disaccharide synthase n=1 Tax=Rhodovastum atsumiense TaxID=504468 RepID=A0A5M6IUP8_9PROT|nr:lipid-A-disaccharide synthase [Rhodovastum atsumiense]KAA5612024.1 lipid-A-disaccharide synthase [Rhodovastum atsumiense]CAH2604114.1 Lipid-A-disaccharide synthase [Rhodovastum atsumiense]